MANGGAYGPFSERGRFGTRPAAAGRCTREHTSVDTHQCGISVLGATSVWEICGFEKRRGASSRAGACDCVTRMPQNAGAPRSVALFGLSSVFGRYADSVLLSVLCMRMAVYRIWIWLLDAMPLAFPLERGGGTKPALRTRIK